MLTIGILIFPQVEELDFIGPFEVLSYVNKIRPDSVKVLTIAAEKTPLRAFNGLHIIPDETLASCPILDLLVIPGGKGRITAMKDQELLTFIQSQAKTVKYLTSVCTGAFFLAEAGLLTGKAATTYHTAFDELSRYSVQVLDQKIVHCDKIITAGGVSSGLELGFYLLKLLFGREVALEAARKIEYNLDVSLLD